MDGPSRNHFSRSFGRERPHFERAQKRHARIYWREARLVNRLGRNGENRDFKREEREVRNESVFDNGRWERGRLARRAELARVTLILTFSHKGRRDLSLAILTWFQLPAPQALSSPVIPAFFPRHSRFLPVILALYLRHSRLLPRHSRESGNPDGGKLSPPLETKYELKPTDPFSLYGRRLG